MAGETQLVIIGNLTDDPEIRYTQQGAAVTNFTVASTPRFFDKQTSEWRDGEALFLRCSVWREQAENVAEHLHKGNRVIVSGQMQMQRWEDKEGNKRSGFQLLVQEIGPSLRFAGAKVIKAERASSARPPRDVSPPDDPWGGRPSSDDDRPPF